MRGMAFSRSFSLVILVGSLACGGNSSGPTDAGGSDHAGSDQPLDTPTDMPLSEGSPDLPDAAVDTPKDGGEAGSVDTAADLRDAPGDRPAASCKETAPPAGTLLVKGKHELAKLGRNHFGYRSFADTGFYVAAIGDGTSTLVGKKYEFGLFARSADVFFALVNDDAAAGTADLVRWSPATGVETIDVKGSNALLSPSPDGNTVIYVAKADASTGLGDLVAWRVGAPPLPLAKEVWYGFTTWTPDGKRALVWHRGATGTPRPLIVVDPGAGTVRTLATDVLARRMSPDGKDIAFVAKDPVTSFNLQALDADKPRFTEAGASPSTALIGPTFSKDSASLYFIGNPAPGPGDPRIRRLSISALTVSDLGTGPARWLVAVAPDETSVAYSPEFPSTSDSYAQTLWLQPTPGDMPTKVGSRVFGLRAYYRGGSAWLVFTNDPDMAGDGTLRVADAAKPATMPKTLGSHVYWHEPDFEDDGVVLFTADAVDDLSYADQYIADAATGTVKKVAGCVDVYGGFQIKGRELIVATHRGTADDGIYRVARPKP